MENDRNEKDMSDGITEAFKGIGKKNEPTFREELEHLINRFSKENGSNTPDFILGEYLNDCLVAFDRAVNRRSSWYEKS